MVGSMLIIVLWATLTDSVESGGKIFPDKNSTAIGNDTSVNSDRYAPSMSIFSFLLYVIESFSQQRAKALNSSTIKILWEFNDISVLKS